MAEENKKKKLDSKFYHKELARLQVELTKMQRWILDKGLKVGTDSLSLNLYLIDISFGIHVNITLGAIIGLLIAFLLADVSTRRRS